MQGCNLLDAPRLVWVSQSYTDPGSACRKRTRPVSRRGSRRGEELRLRLLNHTLQNLALKTSSTCNDTQTASWLPARNSTSPRLSDPLATSMNVLWFARLTCGSCPSCLLFTWLRSWIGELRGLSHWCAPADICSVNISNALTMGLQKDLKLKTDQPNIALTIFFVPYVVFEVPSNILLKRLSPHVWLSFCTMLFGVAMIGQAFGKVKAFVALSHANQTTVKNFSGILATRFFLGLAEAGIFPGSMPNLSLSHYLPDALTCLQVSTCCRSGTREKKAKSASLSSGALCSQLALLEGC